MFARRFTRCLLLLALISADALRVDAALKVSTDFEGGSARVAGLNEDTQEIRISPAGDLKRGMPNWWFLRVDEINTNKPVTIEVTALDVTTPLQTGKTAPLNPGWTLPTRAAFSIDGTNWRQTEPVERQGNRGIYRVSSASPTVWLAWGPPFTPRDAAAFTERMERNHSFAKAFTLGKSREGRVVPGLQIREGDTPASQRPAIWVTGRLHAWEIGGSWAGIGFAEWLSGPDERAKWLRQNAEFFLVPVMDVDHVATGDGGKHAEPQDHNRDWTGTPHWPEVAAAQKRILALAKEGRMDIYLDLHNPSPGQTLPMFYVHYPPYVGEQAAALTERFLACARAAFGDIKLSDGKPSKPEDLPIWERISTPWVSQHGNPQTISFTVEIPWNTPQGTIEGYREVGRKLGLAVEQYFRERAAGGR